VDGKIYAIGGYAAATAPGLRTVEEYDPATDTWTTKADMPTGRHWLSASAVNGKIYAIGGSPVDYTGLSVVEEYDPATDNWKRKADMPTARLDVGTSVVDGMIYTIGGTRVGGGQPLRTVEVYDPLTDIWTTKADMHTGRYLPSTGVVDGKIYAFGGAGSSANTIFSTVEEYNPATDTWTTIGNMPEPRVVETTAVVNGKIYAFGGRNDNYISSTVEEYDPAKNTWTRKSDLPAPRAGAGCSAVNGRIYVFGGANVAKGHPGMRTVYEYDTGLTVSSPDFNGDGTVDIKDILRVIESWGRENPMADIAPLPFGDGIVDDMDLELLMSYWEQPVDDPTLVAHWALDEAQGDIAFDSAGHNDAVTFGAPLWLPDGGMIDGAILLDGVDDSVIAGTVLNPSAGPFSILAWIQGGIPGQTVISQVDGADWLGTDPLDGALMTKLKASNRSGNPLLSQTVVTDGNWHRIGFVWDGTYRTLYVDDILVTEDTQDRLGSSVGGLNIGSGKATGD
jgi:N-acetylneuraminic acid mutarotase